MTRWSLPERQSAERLTENERYAEWTIQVITSDVPPVLGRGPRPQRTGDPAGAVRASEWRSNFHFRRYSREHLRDVLATAGFRVHSLRYLIGWSLPLISARRYLVRSAGETYQVRVPVRPVNELFRIVSIDEQWAAPHMSLECLPGSSLLALVGPTHRLHPASRRTPVAAVYGGFFTGAHDVSRS